MTKIGSYRIAVIQHKWVEVLRCRPHVLSLTFFLIERRIFKIAICGSAFGISEFLHWP